MALVCAAFVLETRLHPPAKAHYLAAITRAPASANDALLVQTVVSEIARRAGESRSVNVNGPFEVAKLNVALVEFQRLEKTHPSLPKEGLLALPPNVLLIDVRTIRRILLQAFNDSLNYVQMRSLASAQPSPAEMMREAERWGALSLQLRLLNLTYRDNASDQYGSQLSSMLGSREDHRLFVLPFVFPIGHELGHLRLDRSSLLTAKQEESAADEFALAVTERFWAEIQLDQRRLQANQQLLIVGLRYFQDLVLADLLLEFRGLTAASLLTALHHKPCAEAASISWPQRFNNPDVVYSAEMRGLPLLTAEEIEILRSRLKRFETPNHANLLARVSQMSAALVGKEDFSVSALVFETSRRLLAIIQTGESNLEAHRSWSGDLGRGQRKAEDLVLRLGGVKEVANVTDCRIDECQLFRIGPGFAEAFGLEGTIQFMRLVQPPTTDGVGVLTRAAREVLGQRAASELMTFLENERAACGLGTAVKEAKNYLLIARTMNTTGWYEFEFLALPR